MCELRPAISAGGKKKIFVKWCERKRKTPGRVSRALIVEDKAAYCFTTGLDWTGQERRRDSTRGERALQKKKPKGLHIWEI